MGTCTIYKSRTFGPRWSGTKELAAYFSTTDGTGTGSSPEVIGNSGRTHVVIDPYASFQTQSADADTSDLILNMDKYENVAIYTVHAGATHAMTMKVWSCPPQPTVAMKEAAAAAITTGVYNELVTAEAARLYGWTQEGEDIAIVAGANDISKLTATGGMMAVSVTTASALTSGDDVRVYVVGEFA